MQLTREALAGPASDIVVEDRDGVENWVVPHAADTTYLTHGYFRYIGKFPPQIASKLIDDHYPGKGAILDPMVGGGTVLAEAVLRGIPCEGWDVNPVSRLVATSVSRRVDPDELERAGKQIVEGLQLMSGQIGLFDHAVEGWTKQGLRLSYCDEYFSEQAKSELEYALFIIGQVRRSDPAVADLLMMTVLSCLRKISYANVKKMNLELDLEKKTVSSLHKEFSKSFGRIALINRHLPREFGLGLADVADQDATKWQGKRKYGMICIHPPYLTNTAFSEATQLQLAVIGIEHKRIWKRELRCRGSFLHETNGLQKYLVNWAKTIKHSAEALLPGGVLAVVVGDGQMDYVRIPVGAITIEFGKDAGLDLVRHAFHILNNHTGQTQNKKMRGQHVVVFEKR